MTNRFGRRGLVLVAVGGLAVAAGGCSGGGSKTSAPQSSSSSATGSTGVTGSTGATSATGSTAKSHPAAVVGDQITLTCDQQLPGGLDALTLPNSVGTLHVSGENWGQPAASQKKPRRTLVTASGTTYEAIVTRTVVNAQAAPTITISADTNDGSLLFYTDAATWGADGSQLTADQIVKNSAHKVTLQSCGSDRTAYAGMFLVKQPGCYSLGIKENLADGDGKVGGVNVPLDTTPC